MRHIIIGAGPAGVVAAETLRQLDAKAHVAIIGEEALPPYSRMAIPYLLRDQIDEAGTYLRKSQGHFQQCKIELIQGRVARVQPDRKSVSLQSGAETTYDKLLIATGSRPVVPSIPGIDSNLVSHCWTLEDARRIMLNARPGSKVVLIGAGFIGCIILEALAARGADLSVVEMEERMAPRVMNGVAGNLLEKWCKAKGVAILTSTRVQAIEPAQGPHPLAVILENGNKLEADLVIVSTGIRPNVEFLGGSGIKTDFGVLVDRYLAASAPDVYAAGDVAQGLDFSTGEYTVQAIQPTAAEHGRIAAGNMAGRTQVHRGSVSMNVLDTMGLVSSSFGLWMGTQGGESAELIDEERFRYLNLQFSDDVLVGASSLGLTDHIGVVRGLIQTKVRLKDWKRKLLQDPTRLMEAYLASTLAIGHNAGVL